jgi:hypothetical protein
MQILLAVVFMLLCISSAHDFWTDTTWARWINFFFADFFFVLAMRSAVLSALAEHDAEKAQTSQAKSATAANNRSVIDAQNRP